MVECLVCKISAMRTGESLKVDFKEEGWSVCNVHHWAIKLSHIPVLGKRLLGTFYQIFEVKKDGQATDKCVLRPHGSS